MQVLYCRGQIYLRVPRSILIDGGRSTGIVCVEEIPNYQPVLDSKDSGVERKLEKVT